MPSPIHPILLSLGVAPATATAWAERIAAAMAAYDISTPARQAAFLAQLAHESGRFRFTVELWGPTAQQLRYERDPAALWARRDPRNPGTFRNSLAYQLGNTQPGDGARYRGRGLIQVTGRFNYGRRRDRLRARLGADQVPDFEAEPEQLATATWGAMSAADFWDEKALNSLADLGDFVRITELINGGQTGLQDRLELWEKAKAALAEPAAALPAEPMGKRSETSMGSFFIPAAFAAVAEAAPSLIRLFGGSAVSERNAKAAEVVVEAAKAATGALNEQELIERLRADPAAAQLVQEAVKSVWYQIAVDHSGIEGARAANRESGAVRPWLNPALWITAALLPLVYLTTWVVLTRPEFTSEVKSMVVASIVSGLLSAVAGYWLGTSFSSSRKTELQQQLPAQAGGSRPV